jgi:pimeloyl-ACP methyl ester carboxylesterase
MSDKFDVLWLSASPSLKHFDIPLLQYLSKYKKVAQWKYSQTKDEAGSLDEAVMLVYECLKHCDAPVHLIGHGISGAIALIFARRYPKRVRSLTLLAVATQPAMTWHTHYYVQRQLYTISQERVLATQVCNLFGSQRPYSLIRLVNALSRDLEESPSLHSLFQLTNLPRGGVSMPLMVCGSNTDSVVPPPALHEWQNWFKSEDKLWECPDGYHFFHYFYPQLLGEEILSFWQRSQYQLVTASKISTL